MAPALWHLENALPEPVSAHGNNPQLSQSLFTFRSSIEKSAFEIRHFLLLTLHLLEWLVETVYSVHSGR
jgi:hypothetical protein